MFIYTYTCRIHDKDNHARTSMYLAELMANFESPNTLTSHPMALVGVLLFLAI